MSIGRCGGLHWGVQFSRNNICPWSHIRWCELLLLHLRGGHRWGGCHHQGRVVLRAGPPHGQAVLYQRHSGIGHQAASAAVHGQLSAARAAEIQTHCGLGWLIRVDHFDSFFLHDGLFGFILLLLVDEIVRKSLTNQSITSFSANVTWTIAVIYFF